MCIRATRLRFGVAHRNLGAYKNENILYIPGRHDPDLELRIEIRRLEHCCAILLQVCLFVYVCLYIGLFSLHLDIEGFFPVCSALLSIYQCLLYVSLDTGGWNAHMSICFCIGLICGRCRSLLR